MFEIIIADLTSMRLRVIVFYLPAIPYLVRPQAFPQWLYAVPRQELSFPVLPWDMSCSVQIVGCCMSLLAGESRPPVYTG